jgi:molybdopterin synthase sulfur carrier subunit
VRATVTVLYFAAVRELVGRAEESVELPEGVRTVAQFAAWLPSFHAELSGRMASVRIARNEAFAADGDEVAPGDVLALIPPVAGG